MAPPPREQELQPLSRQPFRLSTNFCPTGNSSPLDLSPLSGKHLNIDGDTSNENSPARSLSLPPHCFYPTLQHFSKVPPLGTPSVTPPKPQAEYRAPRAPFCDPKDGSPEAVIERAVENHPLLLESNGKLRIHQDLLPSHMRTSQGFLRTEEEEEDENGRHSPGEVQYPRIRSPTTQDSPPRTSPGGTKRWRKQQQQQKAEAVQQVVEDMQQIMPLMEAFLQGTPSSQGSRWQQQRKGGRTQHDLTPRAPAGRGSVTTTTPPQKSVLTRSLSRSPLESESWLQARCEEQEREIRALQQQLLLCKADLSSASQSLHAVRARLLESEDRTQSAEKQADLLRCKVASLRAQLLMQDEIQYLSAPEDLSPTELTLWKRGVLSSASLLEDDGDQFVKTVQGPMRRLQLDCPAETSEVQVSEASPTSPRKVEASYLTSPLIEEAGQRYTEAVAAARSYPGLDAVARAAEARLELQEQLRLQQRQIESDRPPILETSTGGSTALLLQRFSSARGDGAPPSPFAGLGSTPMRPVIGPPEPRPGTPSSALSSPHPGLGSPALSAGKRPRPPKAMTPTSGLATPKPVHS